MPADQTAHQAPQPPEGVQPTQEQPTTQQPPAQPAATPQPVQPVAAPSPAPQGSAPVPPAGAPVPPEGVPAPPAGSPVPPAGAPVPPAGAPVPLGPTVPVQAQAGTPAPAAQAPRKGLPKPAVVGIVAAAVALVAFLAFGAWRDAQRKATLSAMESAASSLADVSTAFDGDTDLVESDDVSDYDETAFESALSDLGDAQASLDAANASLGSADASVLDATDAQALNSMRALAAARATELASAQKVLQTRKDSASALDGVVSCGTHIKSANQAVDDAIDATNALNGHAESDLTDVRAAISEGQDSVKSAQDSLASFKSDFPGLDLSTYDQVISTVSSELDVLTQMCDKAAAGDVDGANALVQQFNTLHQQAYDADYSWSTLLEPVQDDMDGKVAADLADFEGARSDAASAAQGLLGYDGLGGSLSSTVLFY